MKMQTKLNKYAVPWTVKGTKRIIQKSNNNAITAGATTTTTTTKETISVDVENNKNHRNELYSYTFIVF